MSGQGFNRPEKSARRVPQDYPHFLSTLISNLPGMAYHCSNDPGWTMEYVSEGSVGLTGYTPADLTLSRRLTYSDVIHPEDRAKVWDAVQQAVSEGRPYQITYRIVTASGAVKWVWEQGRMVEGGGLEGFITDVTQARQSEEDLSRLASIVTSSDDAIISKRLDGTITSWNRGAERVYGWQASEVVGRHIDVIVPPERSQEIRGILETIRGGGRVEHYETVRLTRDGRRLDVSVTFSPIADAAGRIVGVSAIARDISERKRAERALKKSQYILAKSQEMAQVGNWAWDVQADELSGSDEYFRIFGMAPQEVLQCREWAVARAHPEDRAKVAAFLDSVSRDGARGSLDYRIVRPDGTARYVNTLADKIIRDPAGHVIRIFGITQDITGRKRTETAMEEARDRAELYIDLMGHDINNLNLVAAGMMELALERPGLDGQLREELTRSLEAIHASSRLIGNVRKLQQVRTVGTGSFPTDVDQILLQVQSAYAKVPGRQATVRYSSAVPGCTVMADELLYDVFANLVENAIKHGRAAPSVDIRLDLADFGGRRCCRVAVEDDGPGVPDDLKQAVFGRLHRGRTTTKGSGLGLYLVKTLVESYGGRVWAEDRVPGDPCQGSRFVVLLPSSRD